MMKKMLFIGVLFLNFGATAQTKVQTKTEIFKTGIIYYNPYELNSETVITKEVVTYGKVIAVKAAKAINGKSMYFINMEAEFPKNPMTIMVYKDSYQDDYTKIDSLLGKTIFVSGKVALDNRYKMENIDLKPSITVFSKKQIKIISDF